MESIRTKAIIKTLLGATLGMLIGLVMMMLFATDAEWNNRWVFFAQMVGSCIYGALAMGGSVVYDIESWSLLRATVTHYVVTFLAFVITSEVLGWFEHSILLFVILLMSVIYLFIWVAEYLAWKEKIKKMNTDLSKMILKDE
jgi:MFS family permease